MIRRLLLVLPSAALLLCATPGVLGATTTASAGASTLYAYAAGGATSPTSCPPRPALPPSSARWQPHCHWPRPVTPWARQPHVQRSEAGLIWFVSGSPSFWAGG